MWWRVQLLRKVGGRREERRREFGGLYRADCVLVAGWMGKVMVASHGVRQSIPGIYECPIAPEIF
jgi:hypothetical protein